MPKVKSSARKKSSPPSGFEKIRHQLDKYSQELRKVEAQKLTKTSNKNENVWQILKINHDKSRYVYELYYKKKLISQELYNWLLENKYADAMLISKWKKTGYEKLCCLMCLQKACVCRVPKMEQKTRCVSCGCPGCASGG